MVMQFVVEDVSMHGDDGRVRRGEVAGDDLRFHGGTNDALRDPGSGDAHARAMCERRHLGGVPKLFDGGFVVLQTERDHVVGQRAILISEAFGIDRATKQERLPHPCLGVGRGQGRDAAFAQSSGQGVDRPSANWGERKTAPCGVSATSWAARA